MSKMHTYGIRYTYRQNDMAGAFVTDYRAEWAFTAEDALVQLKVRLADRLLSIESIQSEPEPDDV